MSHSETTYTGGLKRIRERLDPGLRYVVFELLGADDNEDMSPLTHVTRLMKSVERGIVNKSVYNDIATGNRFMVFQLEARFAEDVVKYVVSVQPPKNVIVYVYGETQ